MSTSTLTYDLYVAWTRVREVGFQFMRTRTLVDKLVHAAWLEREYLDGRPHTVDQYERVSDRALTLNQILDTRAVCADDAREPLIATIPPGCGAAGGLVCA